MDKSRSVVPMAMTTLAIALSIGGCGGGSSSSSGTVSGLSLPSSVSVVSAQGSSGAAHVAPSAITSATFASTSDYATDQANSYVYDGSMEALQTVNMILCLMDQTRASDMVNEGAYFALVNEKKCDQGSNQSSSGSTGQSSGTVTQLNKWTIEATRASDTDPMAVKIWVPGAASATNPMDAQNIMVELTATEGVSADQPFGQFDMNFKSTVDGALLGGSGLVQIMEGSLSASGLEFEFYSGEGATGMDSGFTSAVHVLYDDASGTTGMARTFREQTGNNPSVSDYALAFSSTNLLRTDVDNVDTCLARDNFTTHVWRYNLYYRDAVEGQHTAGQRVELNSGFPFTYASTDENGEPVTINGFVGYNGVWSEEGDSLPNLATITRQEFGSTTPTDYTVHVSNGKLIKRERQTLALSKLFGQTLLFWGENPASHEFGQWAVAVDGSNNFAITASVEFGDSGPVNTPLGTPVDITPTTAGQNLRLWADSLGGNVVYVYGSTDVTFYAESFVQPNDATLFPSGPTSLSVYCYDRCVKGGLTQQDVAAMNGVESGLYYPTDGTAYEYTLTSADGKLVLLDTLNSNAEVSVVGLNLGAINHDWGVQTGEMVLSTNGITNPWDVFMQTTTYRWETGDNSWNRLTTVTDADDNFASFDKPLHFTYTVAVGDDLNDDSHVDNTYLLQYGGPGQLWGFPWAESESGDRWYAEVNLNDGVEVTDDASGAVMVLRPIESEQSMNTTADCGALDTTTAQAMSIPTAVAGTVSFDWSDLPAPASDAPAVIEGELQ